MARQQLDRLTQHVRSDLHPHAALGAAVRGEHAAHALAQLLEHLDMVAKAERDGFERRPPDVAERMMQAQTDQGAARIRVVQRRLLAEKVGQ